MCATGRSMSRKELVALFPNGKTLHVPSDGKPLPGYEQALASYQARKKSGNVAIASLGKSSTSSSKRSGGLLAAFFGGGGGADEEEDSAGVTVASAATKTPPHGGRQAAGAKARQGGNGDGQGRQQGRSNASQSTTRFASCRPSLPIRSTCRRSQTAGNHRRCAAGPRCAAAACGAAPAGRCRRRRPNPRRALRDRRSAGPGDQPSGRPAGRKSRSTIPLPTPRPGNAPPPELDADSRDQAVHRSGRHCRDRERHGPAAAGRTPERWRPTDEIAPLIAALPRRGRSRARSKTPAPSHPCRPTHRRMMPSRHRLTRSSRRRRRPIRRCSAIAATPRAAVVTRASQAPTRLGRELGRQDDAQGGPRRRARTPSRTPSRRSSRRSRRPRAGRSTVRLRARQHVRAAPTAPRSPQHRAYGAERGLHGRLPAGNAGGRRQRFSGKAVTFLSVATLQHQLTAAICGAGNPGACD